MEIGFRRCDDAGRESGRIELMLGIENQRKIKSLDFVGSRLATQRHGQEIAGKIEIGASVNRLLATMSGQAADQKWYLGQQPFGFSQRGLTAIVLSIRIEERQVFEAQ